MHALLAENKLAARSHQRTVILHCDKTEDVNERVNSTLGLAFDLVGTSDRQLMAGDCLPISM
jgi:hypothetical protein